MSNEQVAPETKGITVKLLATVDLGPEIEGMAGRQLRMRMVTFEPGGVFGPIHDHKGRPGTVYILQGTITDHRNGDLPTNKRNKCLQKNQINTDTATFLLIIKYLRWVRLLISSG